MYPSEWYPTSEIMLNGSCERSKLNIITIYFSSLVSQYVKQNIVQVSKPGILKKHLYYKLEFCHG